ncbi:MAG: DUF2064 domain-containing protein, partial [Candidatus Kapaibacterium sp.]
MNRTVRSIRTEPNPGRNALLFFVRDERDEAQRKPLPAVAAGGGRQGYRRLNRMLLSRLEELEKRGIDLIVVSASTTAPSGATPYLTQRGETFGERITNGAADAFQLGYHNVVVVGNDCPDISPNDIQQAFDLLAGGANYVGAPTRDGGAFLVGLRHDSSRSPFRNLSWQTSELFSELCLLPDAVALNVIREDFDSWLGPNALRALTNLFLSSLYSRPQFFPAHP